MKAENQEQKENNKNNTESENLDNQIKEYQKLLEKCEKEKKEYLEGWKRERADFLNYKKDEIERIEGLIKYANEELILKFLPILDNLEIAEKNISENLKENEEVKGLLQIKAQILDFLKSQGLSEIKALGELFDPHFHEAIDEIEDKEKDSGIIIEEVRKGYLLNNKVLRPSRVKIVK
ncbi:MAG TPA: nucleotide exchange factor GrpE [Candidatus Pacearchaeota archaeon]|nr:nucleotide exchange factor GrpE [Candidatus Pacearchaeota archaeon]